MQTNNGHTVEVIEGNAAGIIQRGTDIEDLGEQMIGAASLLRQIGEGATEEKGRSIDKIRDEVGDVHEELQLAGERYKPTGSVMKTYGAKLEAVQIAMRRIVADAEDAARILDQKRGAAADAEASVSAAPDADPADATAVAAARVLGEAASDAGGAVTSAENDLDVEFGRFDDQWDTWDDAYEAALRGINDATDGNISDGWSDNLAGVVEVVLKVLSWVGVVLLVLALIIGGPIIGLIAAVVGIIALIGSIFLFAKGRISKGDLAWAIVGALPFGKLGKLFKAGTKLDKLSDFGKFAGGPFVDGYDSVRRIQALQGLRSTAFGAGRQGLSVRAAQGYADAVTSKFGYFGGASARPSAVWQRISQGGNSVFADDFAARINTFSEHHSSLFRQSLGTNLSTMLAKAGDAPSNLEQALNIGNFVHSRFRQGDARIGDIQAIFAPNPVDTWRAQL